MMTSIDEDQLEEESEISSKQHAKKHHHRKHHSPTRQISNFYQNYTISGQGILPLPTLSENLPISKPANSVIPDRFYNQSFSRNHDYNFAINEPYFCTNVEEVYLLVLIASACWEFKRREVIRSTWTNSSIYSSSEQPVKFLFFVATPVSHDSYKQILHQESSEYHDLIYEDFNETYKNLTLKTLGQLKWATYFCPNAKYVMHIDDDVYGAIPEIVKYANKLDSMPVPSAKNHRNFYDPTNMIYCSKVFMPQARRDGKWEMSYEDYPNPQYPLACVGWCFLMPFSVAKNLYFMSLQTPYIHLEDVTVTGILREKIGIEKVVKMDGNEQYCKHLGWPKDIPVEQKLKIEYEKYIKSGLS